MKTLLFCIFLSTSGIGFCQSAKTETRNDESIVVAQKENQKYGVKATFYGEEIRYGNNKETAHKVIKYIIFKDKTSGGEVKYSVSDPTQQAADFYFTDIWSPDEEYLILPIGKLKGFAILKAEDALSDIKANKYLDTIKAKSVNSGWYWHDFEKWEDNSTFSFRAGLEGNMFAYKYNIATSELYCYQTKCEEFDVGSNNKGNIKAIKKGDIETIKKH